jgi:hypothetical protein
MTGNGFDGADFSSDLAGYIKHHPTISSTTQPCKTCCFLRLRVDEKAGCEGFQVVCQVNREDILKNIDKLQQEEGFNRGSRTTTGPSR